MHNKYNFYAYGLSISSDIFCPELPACHTESVDVTIQYGSVPACIPMAKIETPHVQISPDQCLYRVNNIAQFHITNGKDIVIKPDENADESAIRLLLLGAVMRILMHQRKRLVLHGSAIGVQEGCVIFLAPSGYGKSTLAAAFCHLGFPLVTDDVCLIDVKQDSIPYAIPSFPQIKLWEDSVMKLDMQFKQLRKLLPDMNKFALPLKEKFVETPIPIRHIYNIQISDTDNFSLSPLRGIEKFNALKKNTFREWVLPGLDLEATNFKQCTMLGKQIPMTDISRPRDGFRLDELVDCLKSQFALM